MKKTPWIALAVCVLVIANAQRDRRTEQPLERANAHTNADPKPQPRPATTVSTPHGQVRVPGQAELNGHDHRAGVVVDRINIWATPERNPGRVAFSLRNHSPVSLLSTKRIGNLTMFEIESNKMRGWVSELFVAPW